MTDSKHNDDSGILTSARFGEPDSIAGTVPAIVKQSAAMELVVSQAARVAKTDCTVLIMGESGVGKDVLARYIHLNSRCADQRLLTINCGALPETLVESELFGYEKGAFTGASQSRAGLVEAADSSTLFLDEVGELPLMMQVKLLRFLEDGSFRRVGSTSDRRVSVRIIAATNKDLERAIDEGAFREDLYYRLNVVTLAVPPLRERREEIPELVESFLTSLRSRFRRPHLKLDNEARRRLQQHNWPGNVRELRNCLERACALSVEDELTGDDVLMVERGGLRLIETSAEDASGGQVLSLVGVSLTLAQLEHAHIEATLTRVKGNRERAAASLGISSRTLYRKLKEYGLESAIGQVA
jgi:transcriptional regulator with PAS, ATPase and Fis domain